MTIAIVIGICVVVLILAFVLPRLSRPVEHGAKKPFGIGQRAGSKAPGKAGQVAQKPFSSAKKAIGKSGSKGREGRAKAPF
jgi:Family of unknown function (DUF6411)